MLEGDATTSREQRRTVFDGVDQTEPLRSVTAKVKARPSDVTDDDIRSLLGSGLTEDQVFEVVVCAAIGQSGRQYDAALAALDAACRKE